LVSASSELLEDLFADSTVETDGLDDDELDAVELGLQRSPEIIASFGIIASKYSSFGANDPGMGTVSTYISLGATRAGMKFGSFDIETCRCNLVRGSSSLAVDDELEEESTTFCESVVVAPADDELSAVLVPEEELSSLFVEGDGPLLLELLAPQCSPKLPQYLSSK